MNNQSFRRFCKTMELRDDPALIESYRLAHANGAAWPEITQGMKELGILDMEIYLLGTKLFMIMDTIQDFNHEQAMNELIQKPRQREWEQYVSQFQATSSQTSADQKWHIMKQIYKME